MSRIISKPICCVSLFFFFLSYGIAQESHTVPCEHCPIAPFSLQISVENGREYVLKSFKLGDHYSDSLTVIKKTREVVNYLHQEGYLLAHVASITFAHKIAKINLSVGDKFQWLQLSPGDVSPSILRNIGYKERFYRSKPFKYNKVADIMGQLLDHAGQNGYPFAYVKLDSLQIIRNQIGASLRFDPGPLIVYDSLRVDGDIHISPRFLESYLGLTIGKPYNQKDIDQVSQALRQLPYLRARSPSRLTFQNEESTLTLFLEKRKVNQIDGIIGFLPNAGNTGKLLVTGQLDIILQNPFGTGKRIGMHWQKPDVNTQRLNIKYDHPNIWKSPLTAGVDFNFLKEDTLFTNRTLRLQLKYRLNAHSSFKAYTDIKANNLISTTAYENATSLPDIIDFDLTFYGLGFQWQDLDDVFIPKKGTRVSLQAVAGNKKIIQNSGIPSALYEGLDPKTFQYNIEASLENYWPLGNQIVWLNKLKAGQTFNDQLFRNDAYRIGGLNSIRGFNENAFFASQFAYLNTEGRYFLDELSFLSLFVDVGYINRGFKGSDDTFLPVGLGAGINFSTNAGIFNFVYALGIQEGKGGFDFNQSKIHFGYITRF